MNKFHYDNNGIPVLSAHQIEELAKELLLEFDPQTNGTRRLSSMEKLLEYVVDRDKIEFGYEDLSSYGQDVCGLNDFENNLILIDEKLASDPSLENLFNFACGHEIGHWILHRHKTITTTDNEEGKQKVIYRIICNHGEVRIARDNYNTPKGFLEWQANSFSAALLIPPIQVKSLIINWQRENSIRNLGTIYLDNQMVNRIDYGYLSANISKVLGVSKEALKIRLKNLGLLIEEPSEIMEILLKKQFG